MAVAAGATINTNASANMASWTGAAISAGGSAVNSIFGRHEADKARERARTDQIRADERNEEMWRKQMRREDNFIQRRVRDARAAGIHPLAALGAAGPSSGPFAATVSGMGGAPITGSAIGDALESLGASMPNTDAQEATELQKRLVQSQIANLDASSAQMLAEAQSRTKISALSGNDQTATRMFGLDINPSSAFSDVGGAIQQRYGEAAEWFMFPFVALADAYNSSGSTWREAVLKAQQELQKQMRARGMTGFSQPMTR